MHGKEIGQYTAEFPEQLKEVSIEGGLGAELPRQPRGHGRIIKEIIKKVALGPTGRH